MVVQADTMLTSCLSLQYQTTLLLHHGHCFEAAVFCHCHAPCTSVCVMVLQAPHCRSMSVPAAQGLAAGASPAGVRPWARLPRACYMRSACCPSRSAALEIFAAHAAPLLHLPLPLQLLALQHRSIRHERHPASRGLLPRAARSSLNCNKGNASTAQRGAPHLPRPGLVDLCCLECQHHADLNNVVCELLPPVVASPALRTRSYKVCPPKLVTYTNVALSPKLVDHSSFGCSACQPRW